MAKHINMQPILDQLKLEGRFQDAEANYLQELKVATSSSSWFLLVLILSRRIARPL